MQIKPTNLRLIPMSNYVNFILRRSRLYKEIYLLMGWLQASPLKNKNNIKSCYQIKHIKGCYYIFNDKNCDIKSKKCLSAFRSLRKTTPTIRKPRQITRSHKVNAT